MTTATTLTPTATPPPTAVTPPKRRPGRPRKSDPVKFTKAKGVETAVPTLLEPDRCTGCGIYIFSNEADALLRDIPYSTTANHAIDGRCIGCAGGDKSMDHLLALAWQIEHKEQVMSQENGLYLEMETGVMPPATAGGG